MSYAEIIATGAKKVCRDSQDGTLVVKNGTAFVYYARTGMDKYEKKGERQLIPTIR